MNTTTGPSAGTKKTWDAIRSRFAELKALADGDEDLFAIKKDSVSKWSVGEQVDHAIKTDEFLINVINMSLMQKNPDTRGGPTMVGKVILFTGRIPRGKGQAPPPVLPQSGSMEKLKAYAGRVDKLMAGAEAKLADMEACKHHMPHPACGPLVPTQWLRFIQIHQDHHWKIIRDIRA